MTDQIRNALEDMASARSGNVRVVASFATLMHLAAELGQARLSGLLNALQEVVDAADGDGWKVLDPSFEKQRAALAAMKKRRP